MTHFMISWLDNLEKRKFVLILKPAREKLEIFAQFFRNLFPLTNFEYTGSLAHADFPGKIFTFTEFQKSPEIIASGGFCVLLKKW